MITEIEILKIIISAVTPLLGVALGWLISNRSQKQQRKLERLYDLFEAQKELIAIASNIPPQIDGTDLYRKMLSEPGFYKDLAKRMVRLFGIRVEQFPYLESDVRNFIDARLKPFYIVETGTYSLKENTQLGFSAAVIEYRNIVQRNESKLIEKYNRLSK
jgi:hypothetical protein